MNRPTAEFEELAELAAALCDGQITPPQAQRLEELAGQSEAARWHFLQYVQLHGELYWDHAAAACAASSPGMPPQQAPFAQIAPRASSGRQAASVGGRWRWTAAAAAVALLATAAWFVAGRLLRQGPADLPAPVAVVGRLVQTADAQWAEADGDIAVGDDLPAGRTLDLRAGLAEIEFESGCRTIVQGPARLTLDSAERIAIHEGRLAARVPPAAAGFTVQTPAATVVDRGTEFGVACGADRAAADRATEVHVFLGAVEVQPGNGNADAPPTKLGAGEAARIVSAGKLQVHRMPAASGLFVRNMPGAGAGSVAAMRRAVAAHPDVIHHYTFEGGSQAERYRDRRGDLHLREIVMRDGRGGGDLRNAVPGLDATSHAIAPRRAEQNGNTNGVGLESDATFDPPAEMTVELLLRFDPPQQADGAICAAVATRQSQRRCGFLVAAVDRGRLVQLLDAEAPWIEADDDFAFIPGDWHYVATTFRVEGEQTRVSTYVANLGRNERTLRHVVRDRLVPGTPPPSRLGIGKAFEANLTHTYPWAGILDEVAIYNAVLDETTLSEHLRALTP